MKEKLIALFSSPRFLGVLAIAFLQALVLFNVITSVQGEGLIQIIQGVIGIAVTIKTIDRNTGDAKTGVTTVNIPSNVSSVTATTE